jgi:uncharacterized integral membrane protein
MLKGIRYGLGLTTVGLLVLLALQNLGTTEVRLLLWQATLPLFAVILVSVVIGAVIGALWVLPYRSAVRRGGAAPPPMGHGTH